VKSMKIAATGGSGGPKVPEGQHPVYCISIIDIGMQRKGGQYPGIKPHIQMTFELPDVMVEFEGENGEKIKAPAVIGRRFVSSMHKKSSLRKFIEELAGKKFAGDKEASDFDLSKLLGKMFMLNITHETKADKTYANIMSASPCPNKMKSDKPQHHESWLYSLAEPEPSMFMRFPAWLQKVIDGRVQPNSKASAAPAGNPEDLNDDIPF